MTTRSSRDITSFPRREIGFVNLVRIVADATYAFCLRFGMPSYLSIDSTTYAHVVIGVELVPVRSALIELSSSSRAARNQIAHILHCLFVDVVARQNSEKISSNMWNLSG